MLSNKSMIVNNGDLATKPCQVGGVHERCKVCGHGSRFGAGWSAVERPDVIHAIGDGSLDGSGAVSSRA